MPEDSTPPKNLMSIGSYGGLQQYIDQNGKRTLHQLDPSIKRGRTPGHYAYHEEMAKFLAAQEAEHQRRFGGEA